MPKAKMDKGDKIALFRKGRAGKRRSQGKRTGGSSAKAIEPGQRRKPIPLQRGIDAEGGPPDSRRGFPVFRSNSVLNPGHVAPKRRSSPMAQLLHSVAVQNQSPSADGIVTHDLAVNPLSMVLVALRPLNNTGTLSEFATYLNIAGAINRVSILYQGVAVLSMTGRDAAAMAFMRHGISPMQNNHDDTDNERRCVVIPLLLGRRPYDPESAFPASKRGELILEMDLDIADTGYDGLDYSVETVELLDVKPREYERKVQLTQTWGATGLNDLDLPLGNLSRGMLLFGTTAFSGASPAPSWGRFSVHLSNRENSVAASDFEVAHMLPSLHGIQPSAFDEHTHRVNAGSSSSSEETTLANEVGSGGWQNYAFLNLDPTGDDSFAVETSAASRFHIRADAETADAVRVVPIERIKV